jgi:hypothetical protein
VKLSKAKEGCLGFNFIEAEKVSFASARTGRLNFTPRLGRFDIRVPERPVAALPRSRRIDSATAFLRIEECAIVILSDFTKAHAPSNRPHMPLKRVGDRRAEELGNRRDFLVVNPDIPLEARATVPALAAGEFQSVFIPGFGAHDRYDKIKLPRKQSAHRSDVSSGF